MADKRPALGKGLSALIPDAPDPVRPGVVELDIDRLSPNQQQPRLQMDETRLRELADSVATHGVIQPILVRRDGEQYRIIAGNAAGAPPSGPGCPECRSSCETWPPTTAGSCWNWRSSKTCSART